MRFAITAAVWAVILTAVLLLFSVREPQIDAAVIEQTPHGEHNISFEITTTFSVEEDPFALNLTDEKSAFTISLDGNQIINLTEGINDRVPFVTDERMVKSGNHELFVKANPSNTSITQAVRVKVLKSGNLQSDETYWFTPGQSVNASHKFTLTDEEKHNDH